MTLSQRTLWIGTYVADGAEPGSGEGVWQVTVSADGGFGEPRLVVETPAPSFLALHPSGRTLYAVAEVSEGTVTAYSVSDDGAALTDPVTVSSGGASPCHLLALTDALWVANYADGVASVIALDPATGAFAADGPTSFPGEGTGPREDRQEGPHAHFTGVVGERALVCDLGADVLRSYPVDPAAAEHVRQGAVAAALPAGAGPRHFADLPGGALVVAGELDGRLHVLAPAGPGPSAGPGPAAGPGPSAGPVDAAPVRSGVVPAASPHGDAWAPVAATPATVGAYGVAHPSHITATGDLVLVGVRGADALAVHRATPAAATAGPTVAPALEALADIPLGDGAWPRHHAVLGDAVLGDAHGGRLLAVVARQGTSDLASVLIDPSTGEGVVVGSVPLPTPPMCVLLAS